MAPRPTLVAAVVVPLLLAAPAEASDAELDMRWQTPPGCPAYADVESWLHAVIPPDARERLAELHVDVTIARGARGGFSANVRVARDATAGELRVVEGPSCEEVARSAIVVVSVAMSDAIKAGAPRPNVPAPVAPVVQPAPVAPVVQPAPVAPVVQPAPQADRPEVPAPSTPALLLMVSGGVGGGFVAQPGWRADGSVLLSLSPSFFAGVHVHALPAVTIRHEDDVAELHFVAGGLELCGLPELSPSIRAGVCGRAEAGLAWSRGARDGEPSDSGTVAALALTPGASIGGRLRLVIQGDVELRLARPRFQSTNGTVLAALPLVAGSGLLGLSLAIP